MGAETTSLTGARWVIAGADPSRVEALARSTGLTTPVARVLALQWDGQGAFDTEAWLRPSIEHLHDPYAMLRMPEAVDRLRSALRDKEKIRVVTDYDVDGATSSLELQAALRLVDPSVDLSYHIPSRFDEGYGFSVRAARTAAEDGIGLIVTADIGVRDHAAVATAREAGVDVLICDHHLPAGATVPEDAIVLCPPQLGDPYPNRSLAACGVSLKLAQALLADHPQADKVVRSLLKLAAIGTVADMVSLGTLENRAIVALGLDELNRGRHTAGLTALLKVSGLDQQPITTRDLGYRIGPRINAAGRVAEAKLVVELLTCRDPAEAAALAQRLDALNSERRDIQKRLVTEALERVGTAPDPFVVVAGPEAAGWHRGVVGIVASRLKDELFRPVAVVSIQGEYAVGSVRSVPGLHAVLALESVSDLLVKFGGHPAAAGFTVRAADLDALRSRLSDFVVASAAGEVGVPERRAEGLLEPREITRELWTELERLGPFGMGNPRPTFLVPGVRPFGLQVRGSSGALLKFQIATRPGGTVDAVWWDHAHLSPSLDGQTVDLLVQVGENTWNGSSRLQLEVQDARRSA